MANAHSQAISDLSSYGSVDTYKNDDLLIMSSKRNNEYKSFSITFGELYNVIKNKIIADLGNTWENLPVITSLNDALTKADATNHNKFCVGPKVIKELKDNLQQQIDNKKPEWQ